MGVVGDEDIEPAIAVGIDRDDGHRLVDRETGLFVDAGQTCRVGHRREAPVSEIAIDRWRRTYEPGRDAVGTPHEGDGERPGQTDFVRPSRVVANDEIESAVSIDIQPGCAGAPAVVVPGHTGFFRHVFEVSIATIAEEMVGSDTCDVEIGPAIVVEISCRGGHALEDDIHPGSRGNIGKVAMPVVVKQGAARTAALLRERLFPRPVGAVDEEEAWCAVG